VTVNTLEIKIRRLTAQGQQSTENINKVLSHDLPFDPAIPLLGIYPKDCYSRGTCTSMFIAALFTIAKLWKQPRCPSTDEWIKKMWYLYTINFMQP
jgi:hypothetical protein